MKHRVPILTVLFSMLLLPSSRAEEEKESPPKEGAKPEARGDRAEPGRAQPGRAEPARRPESRRPAPPEIGREPVTRDTTPTGKPKRPWVGVATTTINPSLREHLEIQDGFGIQVVETVPDSPASSAGLRNNDILIRFEDQMLISPEHLALLVRTKSTGDKVALTLIRKGREETVSVVLGETEEDSLVGGSRGPHVGPHGQSFPHDPKWQESMRQQQDYWRDWMDKNRPDWRGNEPRENHPRETPREESRKSGPPKSGPPAGEGRPPAVSVNPGFPLRVFGSEGVLKIDNEKGELTLTRKDGGYFLEIKDASGKVLLDGSYDPAKGVESLPEAARRQLEIMKLGNFEILLPDSPGETPEKTTAPTEKAREETKPSGEIL